MMVKNSQNLIKYNNNGEFFVVIVQRSFLGNKLVRPFIQLNVHTTFEKIRPKLGSRKFSNKNVCVCVCVGLAVYSLCSP